MSRSCNLIGHDFGRWEVLSPCKQVRTCRRDGYQEILEDHAWGDWDSGVRICTRCDAIQKCEHVWTTVRKCWDHDHDWIEKQCSICGAVENPAPNGYY